MAKTAMTKTKKAPSVKQLAARKRFALAAKARSKKAKTLKRQTAGLSKLGATKKAKFAVKAIGNKKALATVTAANSLQAIEKVKQSRYGKIRPGTKLIAARKPAQKTGKRNPSETAEAVANRKAFAGQFNGFKDVYAPAGTPEGLSKLGLMAELILKDKSRLSLRAQETLFLTQDNKHKMHIVSTKPGPMVDNDPGDYGPIAKIEYIEAKPHLGELEPIQWVHKMGEITGELPNLIVDKNRQLLIKGGNYSINWRGIIN